MAGHAVAYYTIQRVSGRQLDQALEKERPGKEASLAQSLAVIEGRLKRVLPAGNLSGPPFRPPAVLLAPSGCAWLLRCTAWGPWVPGGAFQRCNHPAI